MNTRKNDPNQKIKIAYIPEKWYNVVTTTQKPQGGICYGNYISTEAGSDARGKRRRQKFYAAVRGWEAARCMPGEQVEGLFCGGALPVPALLYVLADQHLYVDADRQL